MARRSPRTLNLRVPAQYNDLRTTFDTLLRFLAEIDRDLDANIELDADRITSGAFADARIAASNVTQHVAAIDHDALLNFVADEHIDWSVTGVEDVHDDRIGPTAVTQHEDSLTIDYSQLVTIPAIVDGIGDLLDPNEDAIPYWDDTLGVVDWMTEIPDSFLSGNVALRDASNTFTNIINRFSNSGGPLIRYIDSDAALDEKVYEFRSVSGIFVIAARDDTELNPVNILRAERTGINIDSLALSADTIELNGQVLAAFGSATAPAIAFNGDSGTGVYRQDASRLGFAVGGSRVSILDGNSLYLDSGELRLKEKAAPSTTAGTIGQLWVKNTTPCQLWFTDDAGTSTQIV